MITLELEDIQSRFRADDVLARLKAGFVAYSSGRVQLPPAQHFAFAQAGGDCCIKSAWVEGEDSFCVKISSGFYNNAKAGLPSNDGLNMVFSALTGQPLALLNDHGWLTAMRTAIAGRIASEALLPATINRIAIFGTGLQAELQLRQHLDITPCRDVVIWGRNSASLAGICERLADVAVNIECTTDAEYAARGASLIITATPSAVPLIQTDWIMPGTHITAVGADAPGKQELDAGILAKANCVVADSVIQCRTYGELSYFPEHGNVVELGQLIADRSLYSRGKNDITVADLTGLGVQDAQISASILS